MTLPPPPPPPMGPPPGGGYGPYAYGAPQEHPKGTTVLVLGILSLVCCGLLGPVAWAMGNGAIAEIDRSGTVWSNRGSVQAGRVCGIISTCLLGLAVLFVLFSVMVAGAGAA